MRCCGGEQSTACVSNFATRSNRWGLLASVVVNPADLAVLVNSRLSTAGMPPSFWRVMAPSFTAVRGVPHSVVCLLGVGERVNQILSAIPMTSLNLHSASVTETREVISSPIFGTLSCQPKIGSSSVRPDLMSRVVPRSHLRLRSAKSSMLLVTLLAASSPLYHRDRRGWKQFCHPP